MRKGELRDRPTVSTLGGGGERECGGEEGGREAIRRGDIRFRERGETVMSEGRGREGLRFMTT